METLRRRIVREYAAIFNYNKLYIKGLIDSGYLIESVESVYSLEQLQAQIEVPLVSKRIESTNIVSAG